VSVLASAAAPQRIVSTAPSVTEILYALGLGDKVVGVTRFCDYPPDALKKPKIGDYVNPNLEAIAALRPDLVIVQNNPVRLAERLHTLGLSTLEVNQQSIQGIYDSIRMIGDTTGAQTEAHDLIDKLKSQLGAIRDRTQSLKRTRMMFVVGRSTNRLDGLIAVGRSSFLNELIDLAGGDNVFRDAVAAYPAVSLEEVLARNPDTIVDLGGMGDNGTVTDAYRKSVLALWEHAGSVAAVRNHRVFVEASEIFTVPGPRVVEAAREMLKILHPEARP